MASRKEILIAGRPLRRWGKWTGLVLGALSAALLVFSIWFRAIYLAPSGWTAGVGGGSALVGRIRPGPWIPPGAVFERVEDPFSDLFWAPHISLSPGETGVLIPLWLPLAALGAVTGWLFLIDGPPRGCCLRCGYDLTGATGPVCPECGREITDSPTPDPGP